jgi:hypothetical protein
MKDIGAEMRQRWYCAKQPNNTNFNFVLLMNRSFVDVLVDESLNRKPESRKLLN